ncbi:UvrABC system protein A [Phycisphaerae bacterium RAS1]|nr:UvrABC system protein A [Phycisphaerae bacterium RAS1]
MEAKLIRIFGARQHNLQNVSLDLPRERLVVLTGLSGSGKSSLAFDTLYAEGQRKYVESLSVHARHFLEQLSKPDVDRIEGLPPTLAIEQRAVAANPRSTVATTTEIYDFLRVLFARVGVPHCPRCGREIQRRTVDQIVGAVQAYPEQTKLMVLAPLLRAATGDRTPIVKRITREGFVRARVNGRLCDVKDLADVPAKKRADIDVVVDRLIVRPDGRSRLADAIELALAIGEGTVIVARADSNGRAAAQVDTGGGASTDVNWTDETFSERFTCAACAISLPDISPRILSFNSPYGACERCGGLGTTLRFDEQLIVPDEALSLAAGAVAPWSGGMKKDAGVYQKMLQSLCGAFDVKPDTPFRDLPADLRRVILEGTRPADLKRYGVEFEGVIPNLERRLRAAGSDAARTNVAAFQSELVCSGCRGARLRPESLALRIGKLNIHDTTRLSIEKAAGVFDAMGFEGEAAAIAEPILREVRQRLQFMNDVGLGYLTLDRPSATLSGGEAQRIRLATQLGSGLVGVCYVLDEPTIGLHQRDNERLLAAIRRLVDIGNTAIVVEHDEDVIRAADFLVDIGPGAGLHGGRVIAAGPAQQVIDDPNSITGRFIRGEYTIPLPEPGDDGLPQRRKWRHTDFIEVIGARENNLKKVDVRIPLGVLCAVTGVSGSGKSTLVSQVLLPALRRRLGGGVVAIAAPPVAHRDTRGNGQKNGDENPVATERSDENGRLEAGNAGNGRLEADTPFNRAGRGLAATGVPTPRVAGFDRVVGAHRIDKIIEIDQTPIGRTPRSNPATFTGVFDEIRELFAKTREARIRGYDASRFSFNTKGGRCEACQGQGTKRIEMHFLPDIFVECQECKGTRYNRETLEIRYRGKSIADVLDMRVEEALKFFDSFARIKQGIQALSDVGLGYIRLGQPSNTLSGGEAQRVKLAGELARGMVYPMAAGTVLPNSATQRTKLATHTLYVLDEPTTGLHFADIQTLLAVLNRLVNMGNTVLVIEHNLDVIKTADWIIDLGPEGGDAGGRVVAAGTPEQVAASSGSHTGRYLRAKLSP